MPDFPSEPRNTPQSERHVVERFSVDGSRHDIPSDARSVTVRSILWGVSVVTFINIWIGYCEYVIRGSRLNGSHFPVALVVVAGGLALVVWPILAASGRFSWGLSTLERRVVLLMGLIGAAIPANGLTGFLLGIIATPYYYATPENNWASFHAYLPTWAVPPDANRAMRWFFNGLPPGESIPWAVWWIPLFWWATFIAAVVGVCLTVAVILRRQWVEYERLPYPLVEAGLALVAGRDDPDGRRPMLRSRLFWIGFGIAFFILSWNAIGWILPSLPNIDINGRGMVILRGVPDIKTRLNFLTIGLSYFAPAQILGSLLLGLAVSIVEAYGFIRLGVSFGAPGDSWSNNDVPLAWQGFGALLVFVFWGLWQARRHLRDVWRAALSGEDDGRELLSYRTAVVALLISLAYVVFWLHQAGMDLLFAATFAFFSVIGWIALGRMIAEAGYVYQRVPISPQTATAYTLGVSGYAPATMTAFALSYSLIANGRGLFMPAIVQAVRLGDAATGRFQRMEKRRVVGAIALAFVVGIVISVVYTLYLGYEYGAYNFRVYPFSGGNQEAFGHTIRKIQNPFGPDWQRMGMAGIGGTVLATLIALRYRFPGMPIHPIGFVFPFTYLTRFSATSFFVAWLAKVVILKLGGVSLYRRAQPFFLGLAVGYAFGVAFAFAVDWVWFSGAGHGIHAW